jgi:hypothetical protein
MSQLGHYLQRRYEFRFALWTGHRRRSTLRCWRMTSRPLLHSLLHTNRCKRVQEDEEIQNDIDFSSIKPKLKSRR